MSIDIKRKNDVYDPIEIAELDTETGAKMKAIYDGPSFELSSSGYAWGKGSLIELKKFIDVLIEDLKKREENK